jgi:hypothetical protein
VSESKHTPGPWMYRSNSGTEPENWPYLVEKQGTPGRMDWGRLVAKCWASLLRPESPEANARLIAAAPAHALLLSAIVRGLARWEAFPGGDGRKGEVCVGGLRYATELDETGCPVIQPHLYAALAKAEGR